MSEKQTLIILCLFGFFGFGGIHRLYAGRIGSGILYLLTGGIFGIGTIIDLINIANDKFTMNKY